MRLLAGVALAAAIAACSSDWPSADLDLHVADAGPGEPDSDVGCGGSHSPKCAAGKTCRTHDNCASGACPNGSCSESPSCRELAGGATCGAGEVGDANAKHEDCCASAVVPRDASAGGPFRMDRYLVTAGRMRTFLERVGYDVAGYIAKNPPKWWRGKGVAGWAAYLPTDKTDFIHKMSDGLRTDCFIGPPGDTDNKGGPAYWLSPEDLKATYADVGERTYTQAELDVKVMNCFTAPLFQALCAFDGGRLATRAEFDAARTVDGKLWNWPWRADGDEATMDAEWRTHAAYALNRSWPREPAATDNDLGGWLPAPGRFPTGNGPYGHADLFGGMEMMGSLLNDDGSVSGDGWFQLAFQEKRLESHHFDQRVAGLGAGWKPHWAVGGRCVKD